MTKETEAKDVEALARSFHESYERLAPQFGYETRQETRKFDAASDNGRLMIAVCAELLNEARNTPAPSAQGETLETMGVLLELCAWCDTLWESGRYNEVGTGMVKTLKGKIREAYQAGQEAGKIETMRSR